MCYWELCATVTWLLASTLLTSRLHSRWRQRHSICQPAQQAAVKNAQSVCAALSFAGGRVFPYCRSAIGLLSLHLPRSVRPRTRTVLVLEPIGPHNNLLNLASPLIDRTLHALYADDRILMGPSLADVRELYSIVQAAWARALLPVKPSFISLSIDCHYRVVQATVALSSQPVVFARDVARVQGG